MTSEADTERTIDRSQLDRSSAPRLRLIVIGDDVVGTYPVPERGTLLIGRGDTCDVDVDHALISREHARLTVVDGEVRLEDLDSRNGTFVRGRRLAANAPQALEAGQLFEVGETACLLQVSYAAARPRRLVTHGYFEARVEEACARAARARTTFAVLRIHVGDEVPLADVQGLLSGASLVASYATGELEALIDDPAAASAIETRATQELGARCHAAVFPRDGRTVDELLEAACRGVARRDRVVASGGRMALIEEAAPGERLPTGEDKRRRVKAMFDRIAPRYDALNRMMSLGLDQRWRRTALGLVGVGPDDVVADLACGTGDLSEQARLLGARVIGLDFAFQMLRGAHERGIDARFVQGDAARLPLGDATVSVVTCGFALRNFVALPDVFAELARILQPGGRIALIEVDRPRSGLVRFGHSLYFDRVVPFVGGLISDRAAYRYLPESTAYLPDETELLAMLGKHGFRDLSKRSLLLGSAQILTGVRS